MLFIILNMVVPNDEATHRSSTALICPSRRLNTVGFLSGSHTWHAVYWFALTLQHIYTHTPSPTRASSCKMNGRTYLNAPPPHTHRNQTPNVWTTSHSPTNIRVCVALWERFCRRTVRIIGFAINLVRVCMCVCVRERLCLFIGHIHAAVLNAIATFIVVTF